MGERQRWSEASHERLVQAFRNLIQQKQQFWEGFVGQSPVTIVRDALLNQEHRGFGTYDKLAREQGAFYLDIRHAWDVIAFESYKREAAEGWPDASRYNQSSARRGLSLTYIRAKERQEPRPEMIKLDPLQSKILDALAEAADIPHQRGQADIEIPERFRPYDNIRDFVDAETAEEKKRRRQGK